MPLSTWSEFVRLWPKRTSLGVLEQPNAKECDSQKPPHMLSDHSCTDRKYSRRSSTVYRSDVKARACRQAEARATVNPFCACSRRRPLLESLADQIQQPGPCGPRNAELNTKRFGLVVALCLPFLLRHLQLKQSTCNAIVPSHNGICTSSAASKP